MFGMSIDRLSLRKAAELLVDWGTGPERTCRYVVTPNLDHAVQFQQRSDLREAYASASMVVADGWPLVAASRLFGEQLPERVAGSDLVPAAFEAAQVSGRRLTVFLLGAAPGVADQAAAAIERRWSSVQVVGTYSPPLGFENSTDECEQIRQRINAVSPDVLVVGFGAPKQELWLAANYRRLRVGVAVAAGATIDFFAGQQKRAPVWMQKANLEWSHRLLSHPRRLAGRYLRDAVVFPQLLWRERRSRAMGSCERDLRIVGIASAESGEV